VSAVGGAVMVQVAAGNAAGVVLDAQQSMNETSDFDREAILKAAKTGIIITYEDHHIQTGLGSLIANVLAEHRLGVRFLKMGIKQYGSSGKPDDLYKMQGLDVDSLVKSVMEVMKRT
jgi:transketolase